MAGEIPARADALFAPLRKIDNPVITIKNGLIANIQTGRPFAAARDLGGLTLIPPVINAHVHTQLSWLGGKTLWGRGFAPWLKSMVPQLLPATNGFPAGMAQQARDAIRHAWKQLAEAGTGWAGDIGGSIPGALGMARAAAGENGVGASHFCEWFGFGEPGASPWPPRCQSELDENILPACAPAAHALYSTSPEILRKAKDWCTKNGRVFTFHLAESEDEVEALLHGKGGIAEYYSGKVLPQGWKQPALRPLEYATSLGLLKPGTLAVHGVKLNYAEIKAFAQSGAGLCLCPRSNKNLNVGAAPVKKLIDAGVLLCLGTDGLTSNTDLDVRNEAISLRGALDLPDAALLRMLTVNGAAALGLGKNAGFIATGQPARFSFWEIE